MWTNKDYEADLKLRSRVAVCRDGKRRNCPRPLTPEERHERFLTFVRKDESTGCWVWTGCTCGSGSVYSQFSYNGKLIKGHRYSWQHYNRQKIPNGMIVRHKCDNKMCVNPEHLLLGTQKDNVRDMDERGRRVVAFLSGEENPLSKYTAAQVREVMRLRQHGHTALQVAGILKMGLSAVGSIIQGRTWNQVTGLPMRRYRYRLGPPKKPLDLRKI